MDDQKKQLGTAAFQQAVVVGLGSAIAERARLRPGHEEDAIARARLAVEKILSSPGHRRTPEAQNDRVALLNAMIPILDEAEERARGRLGLPQF